MKSLKSLIAIALTAAVVAFAAGCGNYTMADQYRSGISTVFVPIRTRGQKVYRRDLEQRLTEAIVKRIELDTPYKIVAKGRADTVLRGKIKLIEQRELSSNPATGRPAELEITFTLAFTWQDLRSGKVLVDHANFRVVDSYIPPEPIGEDFFQGSEAVINRIAHRVVETMEADW